jgi:hypothetical protein
MVYESQIEKATNAAAQNNECDEKTLACIKASLFGELLFKSPSPIQFVKGVFLTGSGHTKELYKQSKFAEESDFTREIRLLHSPLSSVQYTSLRTNSCT